MDRVLVIEDEPEVAVRVFAPLVRVFAEPVVASTLEAARVALDATDAPFLAIIADQRLPDGTGLGAIARARARWSSIPCLLVTGYIDEDTTNAAFDHRAEIICKPIESSRVRRFLEDASARTGRITLVARVRRIVDTWRHDCHLSEAEADILERTAGGASRTELAALRGVSSEAIDKQVKSLIAKTGDKSLVAVADRVRHLAMRLA